MSISKKFTLYIFLVGALFLGVASIYNYTQARKISMISEVSSSRDSAAEIAQFISKLLREKAQKSISIAQAPVITDALTMHNESLGKLDDQTRAKKIDSLDRRWIEISDENDPFLQDYLDNPVADYFHRLQDAVDGEYGEIFLTDRYGALVASTAKLTTLAHAHKYWWQGSYNEGSGRVFFDDRGYDDSVGDYVLGIVVPIRKNEEIIGILKCNIMVLGGISTILENFRNEGITIGLARSGGLIIYEPNSQPLQARVPEKLIEKFVEPDSGTIVLESKLGDMLTAYAPVPLTLGMNNHGFGGSTQSIDHRQGNQGESWRIYLSEDLEAVYALARERTYSTIITGLAFIMIMAVVSIILGYSLTKPINKLALVAKKIGDGDLNVSEVPDSEDEIGQLGKSIKSMADSLKHTMIRRDELIDEVESHRQTAEALRQSEEKFQALFSTMTEMVVSHELLFDDNGMPCNYRIMDCNQAFCRITGIKKEMAVGKTATQLYETESPPYLDVYAKVALSGEPTEFFTEYTPLDKHFLVSVVSPEKHIFATITSDITEIKRAEEELRVSEERQRYILSVSPSVIYTLRRRDFAATWVSSNLSALMGYTAEEALEPGWWAEHLHREDREQALANSARVLETGHMEHEYRFHRKDGTVCWVNDRMNLHSTPGDPEEIIGAWNDITERKRTESEKAGLEATVQQLQKSESLGRMAGAIAHHFNNQLSVVMGNLELVLDDFPDDAENREILFQSFEAGRKAAEVSQQMLRYLGHISGNQTTINLSDICRQSLALLQSSLPNGVTLNVDFPDSGPFVHADAGHIQQVLTNLFTNAQESFLDNKGSIGLIIQTVSHEDISTLNRFPLDWQPQDIPYACLEITDTGCGISKEDIVKIFDPFYTTKFTGRGMGLPVTMGILKTHGGCITVENNPECGCVFRVYLPVSTEKKPVKNEKVTTPKGNVGNGGTVLLIEDEEAVRNMTKTMLTRLGYKIIEAQDGVEAVSLFQEHQNEIDCVLSDLTMPRMNGWETLTALREKGADVPVILASGYDENTVMAGDHPELPQAFLNKPYSMAALKDVLMEIIRL